LLIVAAALWAGVAPAAAQAVSAAAQPVPMSREWKRLRTANLVVLGNAATSDMRRVAIEIERFRLALTTLAPTMKVDSTTPTLVLVFHDDRALTPFKPRARGKPIDNVAAYFSPHADVNYIVMAPTGVREFTYQVIFHEYTHYIVNQNLHRLPFWLSEGLAEFYGTYSGSEVDSRTIIGRPIPWHIAALGSVTPVPLAQLTSPDALGELIRDPLTSARFYASAWALTHFLLAGQGGANRPKLTAFLREVESGQPPATAFTRVFGEDLKPLERQVQEHIMQMRLPAIQLPAPDVAVPDAPEPLSEADAQQIRGDLLVRMGAFDAAEPYVAKALEAERLHVGARLTRARILLAKDRAADALDLLSAPDLDAPPRFAALLLRGEAMAQTDRLAEAVGVYEQAVALRPDAPGAYYALSIAQLAAGKPAAASFTRCLTLRPDPDRFRQRQVDALRLGVDTYVVSDAVNFIRLRGWQDDASSYVMLAAAFTQMRLHKTDDAVGSLSAIGGHVKPTDWIAKLVAFLQGKTTDDALVASAKGEGELTEAHAYAGIKASIDGDRARATTHLTWVKTSGVRSFVEYKYALGELKRLAGSESKP
jgi:tetratricopeptide (TPR) repeat protein